MLDELTLLRIISGARYSGVPQRVHVLPFTLLAKPKSVTFKERNVIKLRQTINKKNCPG